MKILILGGTSAIARKTARLFAADNARFRLVARDKNKLEFVRADLEARGAEAVTVDTADLLDSDQHADILSRAFDELDTVDVLLIAYGILGSQELAEASIDEAERILQTNFNSTVSLLTIAARRFEQQRSGVIAVLGSVAGDRGKPSNYVYGAAKAGLEIFLEGLRARLHNSGVTVLTIKPGFVDTPMTAAMKKNPLFASSETVGAKIYRAILARQDVVYAPGYWRFVMGVIKSIPTFVFKRMRL